MLAGETCNIVLLRLPVLLQEKVIQCVEPRKRNLWENMLIYIFMNVKVYPVPFSLEHPSEKGIDDQYLELFRMFYTEDSYIIQLIVKKKYCCFSANLDMN